ncbi:unnamed protein product [Caenorhabditis auriculariae]|uniref:Anaphase-promoting complex subunit 2 n=1 Tax=Caenorhabditis auriculariae TaxID=2777116 RepID=A0A8S1H5C4_9PELO|nr:unnamed protein product [Caenorhabditis auriculariae]
MSEDDSMTPEEALGLKLWEHVRGQKKLVWDEFKQATTAPNVVDCIQRLTTVLNDVYQGVQEVIKSAGPLKSLPFNERDLISDAIFPFRERQAVAFLIRPLLLAHFATWRSVYCNVAVEGRVHPWDPNEVARQKIPREKYTTAFKELLRCMRDKWNFEKILEWNMAAQICQLASSYIHREIYLSVHIESKWLKKMISVMRRWAASISMQNAYEAAVVHIYRDMIDFLIGKIYDLVFVEFPRSHKSIATLRYCMQQADDYGRARLSDTLVEHVEKKLLLTAVGTKKILNGYASCVESLRELDTTCVVMHRVCNVIKEYLKSRSDTIQQIISYITSDKKEELEKNMTKRSAMMEEDELKDVNNEFLPENMDTSLWNRWQPDPIDVQPGDSGQVRQGADVFNMLVSVYGSKELFVKEYRTLLADRLSNSNSKDPRFEKRYLDLLKLRFQYSELQNCEVMLKDVEQSQKIDWAVSSAPIYGCIISSHYWPKFDSDKQPTPLPEPLEKAMNVYSETYSQVRGSRSLRWLRGVGCVDVSIELDGVKVEKTVPNMYATVLYLFLEKEVWTATEISDKLGVTSFVAKRRLEWWVKQGLLVQTVAAGATSEEWSLTRNAPLMNNNRAKSPESFDEDEVAMEDANGIVESLEQYWSYTQKYIANHAQNGEVKAEQMHRIYRMFGSPTAHGPTLDHVTTFLQRKVQLGLLSYTNGAYRVPEKCV